MYSNCFKGVAGSVADDGKMTEVAHEKQNTDVEGELVRKLMDSEAFGRLHEVSFLGSIDYFNIHRSNENTSRFNRSDHVLGVLFLARVLISKISISDEDRLYIIAVSICHDLGHSPFSHSTERAYRLINPHINHRIILDYVLSNPEMGVAGVLSEFNLSDRRVFSISVGTDENLSWIFHNPINIDTLDGMLRFMASFRFPPPFDVIRAVDSLASLYKGDGLSDNDVENLDVFWDVKASFYDHFLSTGAYAKFEKAYIDLILSKKERVDYKDYLKRDRDLAEEIGLDPDILLDGRLLAGERGSSFQIDKSITLQSVSDLYRRYIRRGR